MDLETHVHDLLTPLGCPVTHQVRSKQLPSLSYHFFGRQPSLHRDGQPVREETNCQVDIFTADGKSYPIAKKVKRAMRKAGWLYVREDDNFESGTGVYHKVLVFYKEFEMEE